MKVPRHLPYGELSLLPIPTKPFAELTMDFITGFPLTKKRNSKDVYNAILVMVDRFTKRAKYIPARKDWTAVELTNAIFDNVICLE